MIPTHINYSNLFVRLPLPDLLYTQIYLLEESISVETIQCYALNQACCQL